MMWTPRSGFGRSRRWQQRRDRAAVETSVLGPASSLLVLRPTGTTHIAVRGLVIGLGSGCRIRMPPGWRPGWRHGICSDVRWPSRPAGPRSGQMGGAPVPPAPPNKSGILRPGLELAFPLATAKLRPPQATGGTSHPRAAQHAMHARRRQRKIHKILGTTTRPHTTPRMRIEIGSRPTSIDCAAVRPNRQNAGSWIGKCAICFG